ncbi:MAG: hypothetical protein AAF206_15065 [Bacteroidota bacterium]
MNQVSFYKYLAAALFVLNILVLGFFLKMGPPGAQHPRAGNSREGFRERAIDLLKLDAEQTVLFNELAQDHAQSINAISEEQKQVLTPYFQSLVDNDATISQDSLLLEAEALQGQKIAATYLHFFEVRSILHEDQQVHFEAFMKRAMQVLLLNRRPDPNRRKRPRGGPPKN